MITVTRLNGQPIVINADLIEHIEAAPDTIVSLTTRNKFVVLESVEEIIERVIAYKRRITQGPAAVLPHPSSLGKRWRKKGPKPRQILSLPEEETS